MSDALWMLRAVEAAAEKLSLQLQPLSKAAREAWTRKLLTHFDLSHVNQFWADGERRSACMTDAPWDWIRELKGTGPFVLFFHTDDLLEVFQFDDAADAARLTDTIDIAAYHFGVSRLAADFALVKDREGALCGYGQVRNWLNRGVVEPFRLRD